MPRAYRFPLSCKRENATQWEKRGSIASVDAPRFVCRSRGVVRLQGKMTQSAQSVQEIRGRLAPSPTGYLHLGNAWAFLMAWWAARQAGGRIILRLEDIDPQRSRAEYAVAIMEDLLWLGMDWDEGPGLPAVGSDDTLPERGNFGPYVQSRCTAQYMQALQHLEALGCLYPCFCTRKELRALAGAPHVDDMGAPYPGTCRFLSRAQRSAMQRAGRRACLRFHGPDEAIRFTDMVQGPQCFRLESCGGDFAVQRSDGVIAYQLAVAVDDGRMRVNQVVRGRDILPSTPRQIALLRLLGYEVPTYAHVPLLCDAEGERLAKRHGSLALRNLRADGVPPERIVGLLAWLAGANPARRDAAPAELTPAFHPEKLPQTDCRLDGQLMDWLRHGAPSA